MDVIIFRYLFSLVICKKLNMQLMDVVTAYLDKCNASIPQVQRCYCEYMHRIEILSHIYAKYQYMQE